MGPLVAIDPSILSCGIAIGNGHMESIPYEVYTLTQPDNGVHYMQRALRMADEIISMARAYTNPDIHKDKVRILLEVPMNFHSMKGVAARESEGIQKLYALCGAILAQARREHFTLLIVSPKWKGQVPKDAMVVRALRYLHMHPKRKISHDAAEAALLYRYGADGNSNIVYLEPPDMLAHITKRDELGNV